ncbi:hypothetical protein PUR_40870 [Paenibacillus sp. URB8-2]|nr:hypothetical protein PUR_40870 [Paenibacillus sp. URB8-2]
MENRKAPAVTPIKVIVTGATGMVGEGVLHECLLHPEVEEGACGQPQTLRHVPSQAEGNHPYRLVRLYAHSGTACGL